MAGTASRIAADRMMVFPNAAAQRAGQSEARKAAPNEVRKVCRNALDRTTTVRSAPAQTADRNEAQRAGPNEIPGAVRMSPGALLRADRAARRVLSLLNPAIWNRAASVRMGDPSEIPNLRV